VKKGSAQTLCAQGISTNSIKLSQRQPLVLTKCPWLERTLFSVDSFGGNALASTSFYRVVYSYDDSARCRKPLHQLKQQNLASSTT
jgi:hypothetical protein